MTTATIPARMGKMMPFERPSCKVAWLAMRLRSARRPSYNPMFVTMPLIALADRAGHPHSTVTDSNHPHWFGARRSVGRWVNHRRRR
jgi:hypothetical protein